MSQKLKVIKLINDDEIIAMVQDGSELKDVGDGYTTDNLIFVSAPLKIISEYAKETRTHALFLSDWVPAIGDQSLPIDKQKILTLGSPTKDLEDHYFEVLLARQLEYSNNLSKSSDNIDSSDDEFSKLKELLKNTDYDDDDLQ